MKSLHGRLRHDVAGRTVRGSLTPCRQETDETNTAGSRDLTDFGVLLVQRHATRRQDIDPGDRLALCQEVFSLRKLALFHLDSRHFDGATPEVAGEGKGFQVQ